jgi:hypothetical protein
MKGRLNLFQASMLRWRALHPYNAVHVMTLPGEPDTARLTEAIAHTLGVWGLTGLVLDARHGRFEYRGGPARIAIRPAEGDGGIAVLEREIERELNDPFPPAGEIDPFRFFTIRERGTFRLGLGYDHFIAAGDSIVMLMRSIEAAYVEGRCDRETPPDRYPRGVRDLMLRNAATLARNAGALREIAASCRRSVRPRYPHGGDGHNGFAYAALSEEDTAHAKAAAKAHGATLNDLLLAAALFAVAPFTGRRDPARRRHEIGVASIMNIRREFAGAKDAFGQFLSSFRVSHPMPEGASFARVLADVRAQTDAIKRRKLYLQTLVGMGASGIAWHFLDERQRRGVHAKNFPTLAGISNLDVDALWRAGGGRPAPEYVRAVPTGPLSPVVVAVTSSGPRLVLGFSFRTAAFLREEIDRMSGLFVEYCRQSHA